MLRKLISLTLAAALALSLCACGAAPAGTAPAEETAPAETLPAAENAAPQEDAAPAAVTVTDMIGREVDVVPGSYTRVVCIGAGALRMYCYVGDTALLCGVEDIDNPSLENRPAMFDAVARPYLLAYGDVFASLPSCGVGGPMAQTAEAEKILSCDPDIVISEYEDVEKANALQEQLGVPVITLKTGAAGVFDPAFTGSLRLLGTVFGKEARAEELAAFVEAETQAIRDRTAGIPDDTKPGVYICGLGNWGTTNHLMTAESYAPFTIANVRNVVSGTGSQGVGPIEAEKFVELGEIMDIMILDAAAIKNILPLYQEDPTMFDTCKAWQEGEVYLEMAYNAYYTNFEIALINTWFLAMTVYPELFEDVDITEKTDAITEMFLGVPLAEAIFQCPLSFGGYQKIDPETFFS